LRSRPEQASADEKTTPNFFFQVMHPDALSCGAFAKGRTQKTNVKAVLDDVMGHGNRDAGRCILPGELEYQAACASEKAGGLIFTEAEMQEFKTLANEVGIAFP